jgi:hypothetical protein
MFFSIKIFIDCNFFQLVSASLYHDRKNLAQFMHLDERIFFLVLSIGKADNDTKNN